MKKYVLRDWKVTKLYPGAWIVSGMSNGREVKSEEITECKLKPSYCVTRDKSGNVYRLIYVSWVPNEDAWNIFPTIGLQYLLEVSAYLLLDETEEDIANREKVVQLLDDGYTVEQIAEWTGLDKKWISYVEDGTEFFPIMIK